MWWDLFCRVVDNYGDVGVCWRLAADLASRGQRVRLHVDDRSALAWMAPEGAPGVEVLDWPSTGTGFAPGDVIVEAFGCELPAGVVEAMAARPRAPVWINLEYLSAETYVERSHRLPSPCAGLTKWFFYPGYTAATGGLLRESDLAARQAAFDARAWLDGHGVQRTTPSTRLVSLFCYYNPALPALLGALAQQPTVLLATAGAPTQQLRAVLGDRLELGRLRVVPLPMLTQRDYDHLLWASDLNFVRGEDSWVRAQWAGRPFVWQAYPQPDEVHRSKVDAFLDLHLRGAPPSLASSVQTVFWLWNGAGDAAFVLPDLSSWQHQCDIWRTALFAQADLTTQLLGFVAEKG
jgi:uncharacterized repeat protein (TIGR03837 family)